MVEALMLFLWVTQVQLLRGHISIVDFYVTFVVCVCKCIDITVLVVGHHGSESVVCIVTGCSKYERITPVLHDVLHCLLVPQRTQCKIAFLAFNCIRGAGPAYFRHVFMPTANLRQSWTLFCGTWKSESAEHSNGSWQTVLLLQSSGTVFQTICTHPPSQRTVSAWIENPPLPAGLQRLRTELIGYHSHKCELIAAHWYM